MLSVLIGRTIRGCWCGGLAGRSGAGVRLRARRGNFPVGNKDASVRGHPQRHRVQRETARLEASGAVTWWATPRLQGSIFYFIVIEVSLLMLSLESPRRSHFSKMGIIKVMRLF